MKLFGGIIRFTKVYPIWLCFLFTITTNSQILHTSNCGNNTSSFIWSTTTPAGSNNNFDWLDGDLIKTLNNVDGSGVNITYTFSGETATLNQWGNSSTTDSPAVGTDTFTGEKLQFFTNGFVTGNGIIITISFSAPIQEAGFDLIHVNGNGTNGDKYTITATNTLNNTIYPNFTSSATPSYTANNATGVINSTSGSIVGNNANVGVSFTDTNKINSITILWQDCDSCSLGAVHGSGITGLTFCENLPDNDNDTIPDYLDLDDDNDGVLDTVEQNGNPTRDTDGDGIPNHLDLDSDNDGITDVIETGGTDVNKDGIAYGTVGTTLTTNGVPSSAGTGNTPPNSDVDAFPNYLDIDADNDGIPDNIEAQTSLGYIPPSGIATTITDTNNNGVDDNYEELTNNIVGLTPVNTDGTDNPDYVDLDSDNDTIPDLTENGVTGSSYGNTDTDGDGLLDDWDDNNDSVGFTVNDGLGLNHKIINIADLEIAFGDDDEDFNPGTGDLDYRHLRDFDDDGIADVYDLDNDNDGILDTDEGYNCSMIPNGKSPFYQNPTLFCTTIDTDGDGIPNHLDLDSDNDGIPDVIESGGTDINKDGIADGAVGTTPTTNGVPSSAGTGTTPLNSDSDSNPNHLDIDSDNDGIPDNIEAQSSFYYTPPSGIATTITDVNKNGLDDIYENGSVFGINPINSDLVDTPDYLDTDSDNDGIPDIEENGDPQDVTAGTDGDYDGLDDNFDDNFDAPNSGYTVNDGLLTGNTVTDINSLETAYNDADNDFNPGAGNLDFRDNDDTDGDGVLDIDDVDDDNDGILDVDEGDNIDTDGDGIFNHLDLDSDGDGCPDALEGDANIGSAVLMQSNLNGGNSGTGYTGSSSNPVVANLGYVGANGLTMLLPGGTSQGIGTSQDGTKNRCIDTDNDGIADIDDLDDDNDGIMDTQELCASEPIAFETMASIEIEIFMDANPEQIGFSVTQGSTTILSYPTGSFTSGNANSLLTFNQSVYQNGSYTFTINDTAGNGFQNVNSYYKVFVNSIEVVNGTFSTATQSNNFTVASIILDSFSCFTADPGADSDQDGVLNYQDADFVTGVGGDTINPTGTWTSLDADSDGIPNHLDLDSDGDGCPDAIEAAVPALLTSANVVNGFPNTTNNMENAIVNITADVVGLNGFASSLESGDNFAPTTSYPITITNNQTYSLDAAINGCGTAMITQFYSKGTTDLLIEVTNIDDTKLVVPRGAIFTFFSGGTTTNAIGGLGNVAAILPGESMLFKTTNSTAQIKSGVNSVNIGPSAFPLNFNDILTISRSSLFSTPASWESRIDVITNLTDNTSFVRIDETLVPNTTYTASEWIAFIDDRPVASGGLNPYATPPQRHPHDPLLSEITSGVDLEANTLLGLHRFAPTIRTGAVWSNGFPDRSRHVLVNENYNHTGSRLSARKLSVNNNSKLAVTDNLLVVTNDITLTNSNDEIRLVGTSQLVQTHTGTTEISGTGKLLVDQNSAIPSKYRYNYLSSPVNNIGANNFSIETVLKDGTVPLDATTNIGTIAKDITFVSGFDGDTTSPISLADYWIYTFTPSSDGRSNWLHKYKDGTIKQTDGFILKGPGVAQSYTFVGTPKDGELTANPAVDANEYYLTGNPFSSAISVKKFIEDNLNSTTATLYFWQHVNEENITGTTSGHNYAGYIGGYATRNIAMGLSANNPSNVSGFSFPIQAESLINNITNGSIVPNTPTTGQSVVLLNSVGSSIEFSNIIKGVDVLKINYQSLVNKSINIKINGVDKGQFDLASTGSNYAVANITLCAEAGSNVTIISNDTEDIYIDFLQLEDADGNISCAPSAGGSNASLVPEAYIPIGQGFFIQGDSDGGPIVFNNSQREFIPEGANSVFFRQESSSKTNVISHKSKIGIVLPIIKLGMDFINNSGRSIHRQLGVSFNSNNSFKYDKGYDSEIYDLGVTDVYWKFPKDHKKYVIAGVQEVADELEIPFIIKMNNAGSVIFQIDEIKAIDKEVFIKDNYTNKAYRLNEKPIILELQKGTHTNRFSLAFNSKVLALDDNINNVNKKNISIYIDEINKNLVILNYENVTIKKVELYNILGQKNQQWNNIKNKLENRLKIKNFSKNFFLVKIDTNNGEMSKKLIKIK